MDDEGPTAALRNPKSRPPFPQTGLRLTSPGGYFFDFTRKAQFPSGHV
jgi:hypothetical protein